MTKAEENIKYSELPKYKTPLEYLQDWNKRLKQQKKSEKEERKKQNNEEQNNEEQSKGKGK